MMAPTVRAASAYREDSVISGSREQESIASDDHSIAVSMGVRPSVENLRNGLGFDFEGTCSVYFRSRFCLETQIQIVILNEAPVPVTVEGIGFSLQEPIWSDQEGCKSQ